MYFSMSLLVTKTLNKIVDVAKSEIVPVVKLGNLNAPTNILCCKIGSLPMTYLGKPFGAPFQAISIWDPIIEKMERKLSLWKNLYSSISASSLFLSPGEHLACEGPLKGVVLFMDNSLVLDSYNR